MGADTHAVCLLVCEQNIADIDEPCGKATKAVVCERTKPYKEGLSFRPRRMCSAHAWLHAKDPVMEVTWLIEIKGV